jgi:hypothetical protein
LEQSGFAPRTSRKLVRSRSGTGRSARVPNMWYAANMWGRWSTEAVE